jgi:hypothetical protein
MRTIVPLVALLAGVAAASAAAASSPTTTFAPSTLQVGYGHAVKLAGRVSSGAPHVAVTISARPFNRADLHTVAVVHTGQGGYWTYAAKPHIATTYRASIGNSTSPSVFISVRPALALSIAPTGAVVAGAAPAGAFKGRFVQLQEKSASGTWSTIAKRPLDASGDAVFAAAKLPAGTAQLRVVMSVNQAGEGYLGGFSQPVVYRTHAISLAKAPLEVGYGNSLELSGQISTPKAGVPLVILSKPFAAAAFQPVATVHTSAGGKWQYRVKPPVLTSYAARWGSGQTRTLTVGVRPSMKVRLLAGDRVQAHVGLSESLAGKTVQLQQPQPDGTWKTIDKAKLNAKGSAMFPPTELPAGTATLRSAISVNQVGAGFLGGFSRSFVYHR